MYLAVHERVIFTENTAAFAVANNHVRDVQVAQHGGRDFTGEGAVGLVVQVLRAQSEVRTFDGRSDRREGREGRAKDDIDVRVDTDGGRDGLDEFDAFRGGLIHLPVTSNEGGALRHISDIDC